jgi:hypothetical protein
MSRISVTREQLEQELNKIRPQYIEIQRQYVRSIGKQRKQIEPLYREISARIDTILWKIASLRDDYI